MKRCILVLCLLASFTFVCSGEELREVIVSHTDNKGVLQLFRKKEDGSGSVPDYAFRKRLPDACCLA